MQYADLFSGERFELEHMDQVFVDMLQPSLQSVVVEGAVSSTEAYDNLSSTALMGYSSGRIFYQFYPGETVKQMLSTIAVRLLTVSDLEHSYLLRGNSRIPLNVQQILYGNDAQGAQRLQAGDTILIPFSQRFVSVSGGVLVRVCLPMFLIVSQTILRCSGLAMSLSGLSQGYRRDGREPRGCSCYARVDHLWCQEYLL